jgi:hypothetical protein
MQCDMHGCPELIPEPVRYVAASDRNSCAFMSISLSGFRIADDVVAQIWLSPCWLPDCLDCTRAGDGAGLLEYFFLVVPDIFTPACLPSS